MVSGWLTRDASARCRAGLTIDPDRVLPERMTVVESEDRVLRAAPWLGKASAPMRAGFVTSRRRCGAGSRFPGAQ
jgi:hypothetical protein